MSKETLTALLGALLAGTLSAENLTREQLDKLLAELAENPAPEEKLVAFAMCYLMSMPPDRAEYVCPTCGEKTIHVKDAAEITWQLRGHQHQRDEVRKLGLDISLDERAFCASCKKVAGIADDKLEFYIEIRINDKTTRTLLKEDDWIKLIAFMKGEDTWKKQAIGETYQYPLKPELPRIRQLLGLEDSPVAAAEDSRPPSPIIKLQTSELEGERPREPQQEAAP